MTTPASSIQDLVNGTLDDLGRMKFQQVAQSLQNYEVMSRWLKKDRLTVDDGKGIQRTIMVKTGDNAKHVGLYEADDVNVKDHLALLNVPWRHAQTFWAFEHRETLMNRGKSLITNVIKPRRAGAMIDMAALLEGKAWGSAPGTTDTLLPYSIKYWLTWNSTEGFTGGNPGSHTSKGGVDCDTYTNWKNYSCTYAAVTKADLIKDMRTAKRKTNWKSPVTIQDYRGVNGNTLRYYMNETTISAFEDLGEAQNENLGRDLAPMDGQMTFRGHPLVYVPQLDGATGNPIYGVDHGTFYPVVLKGDFLRESKVLQSPTSHNVFTVFVDLTYNYVCVDPRRNMVAATADPA